MINYDWKAGETREIQHGSPDFIISQRKREVSPNLEFRSWLQVNHSLNFGSAILFLIWWMGHDVAILHLIFLGFAPYLFLKPRFSWQTSTGKKCIYGSMGLVTTRTFIHKNQRNEQVNPSTIWMNPMAWNLLLWDSVSKIQLHPKARYILRYQVDGRWWKAAKKTCCHGLFFHTWNCSGGKGPLQLP